MATKISDNRMDVELTSDNVIVVKAINLKLLERFDLEHQAPSPPQKKVEIVGGQFEYVDDEDDPEYKEALAEYGGRMMTDLLNLLVLYGMDVELPEDDSWIDMLALTGVTVNEDDPLSVKLDYVQLHLMGDVVADVKRIMKAVFTVSGVGDEVISQWETMFPS